MKSGLHDLVQIINLHDLEHIDDIATFILQHEHLLMNSQHNVPDDTSHNTGVSGTDQPLEYSQLDENVNANVIPLNHGDAESGNDIIGDSNSTSWSDATNNHIQNLANGSSNGKWASVYL